MLLIFSSMNKTKFYEYMNGYISDKEAEKIFGDMYDEVKGAKIMREQIKQADDLYMKDKNLKP